MPPNPPISTNLAKATDTLLATAIDAIDAAGADWNGPLGTQHTLLVPGNHMERVQEAMEEWDRISCTPDACERWDRPQPAAAQNIYMAVEQLFDLPPTFLAQSSQSSEARIPVSVMGSHLAEIQVAREKWIEAWQPPRHAKSPRP